MTHQTLNYLARIVLLVWFFVYQAHASENDAELLDFLTITGELTQGSVIKGKKPNDTVLYFNEAKVRSAPSGEFIIGFNRDEMLNHKLKLVYDSGKVRQGQFSISKRDYQIQRIEGVPQKTVNPSKEHLDRIAKENAQVAKAREVISDHLFFLEQFVAPMKGPITGVYGSQRIYNGEPKRPHFGVDYAGPVGTLVYAPASGEVRLTHNDMFFSGGTLILDHGYGLTSSFLHLSEVLVKEGQIVKQGEPIAKVGQGGRATGPHLDWRMNWFDTRIDPLKMLKINGK